MKFLNKLKKSRHGAMTPKTILQWVLIALVFVSALPSVISQLTVTNLSSGAQSLLNLLPLFMVIGLVIYVANTSGAGK